MVFDDFSSNFKLSKTGQNMKVVAKKIGFQSLLVILV